MKSILLFSVIAVTGACVDPLDPDGDTMSTTDTPRLAVNGMLPSQMQYTDLDQAPLTAAAIDNLASTADGIAYLDYVVSCALDGTQSISAGGVTLFGGLGLAPAWTTRSITLSERRWVSACMIARTNYVGTRQHISLRGSHAALAIDNDAYYLKQEGAYYGDVFSGNTARRVCQDPATLDGSLNFYFGRRCSYDAGNGTSMCGYALDYECAPICTNVDGVYTSCTDSSGVVWNEVVKVNDF